MSDGPPSTETLFGPIYRDGQIGANPALLPVVPGVRCAIAYRTPTLGDPCARVGPSFLAANPLHTDFVPQDWNGVTSRDLRRRIRGAQRDLERLVKERRLMRRDIPERDAISHAYDLAIYAANSRVETSSFLLARLEISLVDHVWDRYLIVYLHAAMEAFPHLAGRVIREFRRLHDVGCTIVDSERLTLAHGAYKEGVKQIKSDHDFMENLDRVRNTVGAHHLSANSGIEGLVAWIETQSDSGNPSDPLVMNTFAWSMHALEFGHEALAALNWAAFPEIPDRDEYLRRAAALDHGESPD